MINSHDCWRLPEFIAFCDAIGVPREVPTLGLVITIGLDPDDLIHIAQTYRGEDRRKTKIETTTLRNEEVRTFQPPSGST